eukprot:1093353-Pelagomonas_calceolata.AAC.3
MHSLTCIHTHVQERLKQAGPKIGTWTRSKATALCQNPGTCQQAWSGESAFRHRSEPTYGSGTNPSLHIRLYQPAIMWRRHGSMFLPECSVPVGHPRHHAPPSVAEFMQWFKMYHDQVTGGQPILDYDGPGRRAHSKTGDIKGAPAPQPGAKAQQSMRQMATPTGVCVCARACVNVCSRAHTHACSCMCVRLRFSSFAFMLGAPLLGSSFILGCVSLKGPSGCV